jgi:hypothetical protein
MNDNIKAGADINAGDGGYSIGTQEKYDEFVKGRNESLGKMRIREFAEQSTTYIEPTSNSGEGWIFDKEKFAELIVRECARVARATPFPDTDVEVRKTFGHTWDMASVEAGREIVKHFGVGE